jgi:TPR repeat protein
VTVQHSHTFAVFDLLGVCLANLIFIEATSPAHSSQQETQPETVAESALSPADLARRAESGDKESQYWLAVLYQEGRRVEKDYIEAAKWYRRSAEQGWPGAQNNLGHMYDHG